MRVFLTLLLLCLAGCGGGGGGSTFIDDPFFNDLPPLLAFDDDYSTFQNRPLTVGDANGVLRNDLLCTCDFRVRFPRFSANGGSVEGMADGSFIYNPPTNFLGNDFFDYELEDDFGFTVGRVRISVTTPPPAGFFVDSLTGSDTTGSGISGAPFATIQAAVAAAANNQIVTIRPGNGTAYTGTVILKDGQSLIAAGFEGTGVGTTRPLLSGPVRMGNNCLLRGLEFQNSPGLSADGRGSNGGQVALCHFSGGGDFALDLSAGEGAWLVLTNRFENGVGGLQAALNGSSRLRLRVDGNTFGTNTQNAVALSVDGTADITAGLFNNTFTANLAGSTAAFSSQNTGTMCLDLVGNQNDDAYRFTHNGASMQVEQFGQLGTLNTGAVTVDANPVQDVLNGTCGF